MSCRDVCQPVRIRPGILGMSGLRALPCRMSLSNDIFVLSFDPFDIYMRLAGNGCKVTDHDCICAASLCPSPPLTSPHLTSPPLICCDCRTLSQSPQVSPWCIGLRLCHARCHPTTWQPASCNLHSQAASMQPPLTLSIPLPRTGSGRLACRYTLSSSLFV